MTGLRRWRRVARSLIIFSFTWEVVAAIASLVLLIFVAIQGDGLASGDRLVSVIGTFGIFGVVIGAIWDARRRRRRQDLERMATADEEA